MHLGNLFCYTCTCMYMYTVQCSSLRRSRYVPPMTKLLIALRYYAAGSMQVVIADFVGVCISTVCRHIRTVTDALVKRRKLFIKTPETEEERKEVCEAFYAKASFPRCIGAIDCTHIRIQSPGGENAENYRNRKGFFSLNVQTICDANLKVLFIPNNALEVLVYLCISYCSLAPSPYFGVHRSEI